MNTKRIVTYFKWLFVCLALAACSASKQTPVPTAGTQIDLQDCQLSTPGISIRLPAKCGALQVPEDRSSVTSRKISLNIAVIPAVSRNPAPDPVFFLAGGPGQAATESYPQLHFAFERIRQKRDIVLVDQRGTGQSNPLKCPVQDETDSDLRGAELKAYLNHCLSQLEGNPRFYTTTIASNDLEEVRRALGYEQINLYGVSYGSRVAMIYLKEHSERVRAAILDGVVPLEEALGSQVAIDAQRALDLIFARCSADPACRQAFPELPNEFNHLLEQLQGAPIRVRLIHPTTGEEVELDFTVDRFAATIRLLSYTQETAALIPLLIHTSASQTDYKPLASQYLIVASQLGESISTGMNYSVLCAEDYPFLSPDANKDESEATYLKALQIEELEEICSAWPITPAPPAFKEPLQTDVSILILSGEADPVTPPANGEEIHRNLPNSLHLIAPGQGHNVIYRGCIPNLAGQFFEAGSVDGLDSSCVQSIRAMPFFLSYTGPTP